MINQEKQILFEPWNMGDALIAAAIAVQRPQLLALACNSRWHPLILAATVGVAAIELVTVDLDYVKRGYSRRTELGPLPLYPHNTRVLTIRGDIRDYIAAKRIFPQSNIRASGWLAFAARRSRLLDIPFSLGWVKVRNRYRAWASIAGVKWDVIEQFYGQKRASPEAPLITVHFGAQWCSRQYPHIALLAELLYKTTAVQLVGGPGDPLPLGISEGSVRRLIDAELVDAFRASTLVIANDSGAMHLAAFLRCQVVSISRISSIAEWLPPSTMTVQSKRMPHGYRPDTRYMSDDPVEGWPAPAEILQRVQSIMT